MQVFPVFLPLKGCPFRCIYCDQYLITGSDHFNLDEHLDDVARFCQIHQGEEKEIAFFGGTFTALSLDWQREQFKKLAKYIDNKTGIRYSTRPDCLTEEDLNLAEEFGVKTIELGIQDFADDVLQKSGRGYKQSQAIEACKLVQAHKFNLGIQIMPGLPGYSSKSLNETSKLILELKPAFVRIYPTVVLQATKLADLYSEGKYKPLGLDEAIDICVSLHEIFTNNDINVIKMGVQIDTVDPKAIIAGPYHKAFGELVQSKILINSLVKNITADFSELEIITSKHNVSKLTGHKNYGLNMIKQRYSDKKVKLTIDTNTDECFVRTKLT